MTPAPGLTFACTRLACFLASSSLLAQKHPQKDPPHSQLELARATASGTGSDHGWGNHLLVLGGSVNGQQIHGRFPILNSSDSAYDPNAFADARGVLLPTNSLAQFGATLARWMGAADTQLNGLFPELASFAIRDLGFVA